MIASAPAEYIFAPHERPLMPGSPYSPMHPPLRRAGYAVTALLVGLTATLGNALVTVNVGAIAGSLGLDAAEASWLPAVYVAMNASANLLLIKARIQFGIPAITRAVLIAYAIAVAMQLLAPGFAPALVVRAASGICAAGLTTMTIYSLFQVFPAKLRPLGLVVGICIPQFGTPIARLFPVDMLAVGGWRGLHLTELGLAFATLAAITALPIPPSDRSKAFEPLDLVSIALFIPAMTLVCGVLGVGRQLWWVDAPWLGWMLVAAAPLFTAAILIELYRKRPLLQLEWIGSADILRFAAVALLIRFALAEQTYGAVGLLTSGGLTDDQLHILFGWVIVAMLLGLVVSVVTLSEERILYQVMVAALAIAAGAGLDSDASNITRPEQLYFSQALIGFGAALFIGPALVFGFLRMLPRGPDFLVSLVVLFSLTQNIGGLAGSAALGSYQTMAARAHAASISERLLAGDPQVAARLQVGAGGIGSIVADPLLRSAEGGALLGRAISREAAIRAFNDVFRLVMLLALTTAGYIAYRIGLRALRGRLQHG
jgi:hypothetical protein